MSAKIKIVYYLSEEGRKQSLLAGGDGKQNQEIWTESPDESADALKIASVSEEGNAVIDFYKSPLGYQSRIYSDEKTGCVKINNHYHRSTYFDAPQPIEKLLAKAKAIIAEEETIRAEYEALWEKYAPIRQKYEEETEAANQKYQKEKEETEKRKQEAEDAKKQERLNWITQNGSEHLREAVELGYNCQRKYVTERAAKELPDFQVDFDENACWNHRACPSLESIKEIKNIMKFGFNAEVVWLTHPASNFKDEEDEYNFEQHEAIIITDYLEKYQLIKDM
jgi:hypothetical protein